MGRDNGLDTLLALDGLIIAQEGGCFVKFEVRQVDPNEHIPHGVKYSLTLHDHHNQRVMGFDNAHAAKGGRKRRFAGRRVEYDHHHEDDKCLGVPYEFDSPDKLVADFWQAVDATLLKLGVIQKR